MSKDHDVLRTRIHREVWRLTRELGLKGWNTVDLAAAAGISKRTLYKIVPAKESVLKEVVVEQIRATQKRLARAMEPEGTATEKLNRIAETFPRLLLELGPQTFQQIYRMYPSIEDHVAGAHLSIGDPIIGFFRTAKESGEIKSEATAETL